MIIELLIGSGIGYCVCKIVNKFSIPKCQHTFVPVHYEHKRGNYSWIHLTDITYQCKKCHDVKLKTFNGYLQGINTNNNNDNL